MSLRIAVLKSSPEKLVLQSLDRRIGFIERETDEQSDRDNKEKLGIDVCWRPPNLLEDTTLTGEILVESGGSKLLVGGRICLGIALDGESGSLAQESGEFLLHTLLFRAIGPNHGPIDVAMTLLNDPNIS